MSKAQTHVRGIYRRGNIYWLAMQRNGRRDFISLETSDFPTAIIRAGEMRAHPGLQPGSALETEIDRFLAYKRRQNEFTRFSSPPRRSAHRRGNQNGFRAKPPDLRLSKAARRPAAKGLACRQEPRRPAPASSGPAPSPEAPLAASPHQSDPQLPVAENWLAKVPAPERPDQTWVADIPYIETKEGWLYLSAIMDLFSRKILGWNTAADLSKALVTRAADKAWKNRRHGRDRRMARLQRRPVGGLPGGDLRGALA